MRSWTRSSSGIIRFSASFFRSLPILELLERIEPQSHLFGFPEKVQKPVLRYTPITGSYGMGVQRHHCKSAGLGAISGAAETYWGKNKGRSMEGLLVKLTKILAALFMILAVILNLNVF